MSSQTTPPEVERGQRVDERVDQVTVVLAPPQQDRVDDLVVVLVDELAAGERRDRGAQLVVAVLVVAELLDDLTRA